VHAVIVAKNAEVETAQAESPRGDKPSGNTIVAVETLSGPSAVNVADDGAEVNAHAPTTEVNRASFFAARDKMSTQELAVAGWATFQARSSDDVADAHDDEDVDGEVAAQARSNTAGDATLDAASSASLGEPADDFAIFDDEDDPTIFDDEDDPVPPPVDATSCTIAVWRGYRKAMFYAQAFDARGGEVALAESPPFRYRGNGMPEKTQAAADAHDALVESLRHSGWEPDNEGGSWFDLTLTRR
jgi:hypothetical protein